MTSGEIVLLECRVLKWSRGAKTRYGILFVAKANDFSRLVQPAELKEAIADRDALEKQVKTANADRDAMKRQSESLQQEYDRVSEEVQTLQV